MSEQRENIQATVCIIKPDAFHESIKIIDYLMANSPSNIAIVRFYVGYITHSQADEFYSEDRTKSHHKKNVSHVSSGLSTVFVVVGEDALENIDRLKGATDPSQAAPNTIRAKWGTELPKNAFHSSKTSYDLKKEYKLLFGESIEALSIYGESILDTGSY